MDSCPKLRYRQQTVRSDPDLGQVTAALIAVSPMLVWFSQEARAYVLLVFMAAVSLWCWARAYMRGETRDFILWGVAAAAALSTHYFAAFLILPEAVALAVVFRSHWRRVATGCAPIAATGLALYVFFYSPQRDANLQRWLARAPLRPRVAEAGRQALIGPGGWDDRLWLGGAVLVVVAVVLVAIRADRRERRLRWNCALPRVEKMCTWKPSSSKVRETG